MNTNMSTETKSSASAFEGGSTHAIEAIQFEGTLIPIASLDGSMTLTEARSFIQELEDLMNDDSDEVAARVSLLASFDAIDSQDALDAEADSFEEFLNASLATEDEPTEGFTMGVRGNSVGWYKNVWEKAPHATDGMSWDELSAYSEARQLLADEAQAAGVTHKWIYDAAL